MLAVGGHPEGQVPVQGRRHARVYDVDAFGRDERLVGGIGSGTNLCRFGDGRRLVRVGDADDLHAGHIRVRFQVYAAHEARAYDAYLHACSPCRMNSSSRVWRARPVCSGV